MHPRPNAPRAQLELKPVECTKGVKTMKAQWEVLLIAVGAEMWEGGCSGQPCPEHKGLSREIQLP